MNRKRAFVGIDVAIAKKKRLPVCVAVWNDSRLKPLLLRSNNSPVPPQGKGNARSLLPEDIAGFCQATLLYLQELERRYGIEIVRIAIDAPSDPKQDGRRRRAAEVAMDRRGISCITTPSTTEFTEIRRRAQRHLNGGGPEPRIPHANQLWMLVGFELFETLRPHYECLEVFPQATAFELGAAGLHKSKAEGALAQLTAAYRYTNWPEPPVLAQLKPIAYGAIHDKLDAYLSVWVAALEEHERIPLGTPPNDVIWIPRLELLESRPTSATPRTQPGHSSCPFCTLIADRQIRAESEAAVAFPDAYPLTSDHTLIVPKRHVRSVFELSASEQADLWKLVARVRADLATNNPNTHFTVGVNDGEAAGQTIDHAHVHVIPRRAGDVPDPRGGIRWVLPEKADYWSGSEDAR